MVNIAICDSSKDEMNFLEKELISFAKKEKYHINVEKFSTGIQLINYYSLNKDSIDIIFLEIEFPNNNGLRVASELRELGFQDEIIFNTKSRPEVFKSFDVDAFHYILKDETTTKKKEKIFHRAFENISKMKGNYLSICCGGENVTLPIRTIQYIKARGNLKYIHYDKDKVYEFYTSLERLELALGDKGFVRISKGILINLRHVKNFSRVDVTLRDGTVLEIGRVYKKKAILVLNEYLKSKEVLQM
ncbi:MAG: LytTR family DNA-binding domain-containing protein [Lachnospiraceae bacterium]|nr:LytTR family DNA-binding domain-containing protein [Lachnospiraceae bacterium]